MKSLTLCIFVLSITITIFGCDSSQIQTPDIQDSVLTKPIRVSTLNYAVKGQDTLGIDVYHPNTPDSILTPLVIFVHGGAFKMGVRTDSNIVNFCTNLAKDGILAAAISYRLYLKGQSFHCDQTKAKKIAAFETASIDTREATRFLLGKMDSLNFNPNEVILAGSSSGAETILHTAYWPLPDSIPESQQLPTDFKYAGLIALAGASADVQLISRENAIPMMLFHGTCDQLVPYDFAPHHYCPENTPGALPLWGSYGIAKHCMENGFCYQLISECGGKHGMAVRPLYQYYPEIKSFIENTIIKGDWIQSHRVVQGEGDCRFVDLEYCK